MYFKNVNFLRFFLAILIVSFHGYKYYELPTFLSGIKYANVCVDFFFIIAGFFLFYKITPDIDIFSFAKKKFLRLAPNLWMIIIIFAILSLFIKDAHWNLDGNILRIFMLNSIGFSPVTGGNIRAFTWFISALFWCSLFYAYTYKIFEKKYFNLLVWILMIFCYAIYMHNSSYHPGGHTKNLYLIFNIGICRALASMGLGYFISMAYKNNFLSNIKQKGKIIIISLIECFLIGYLFYYLVISHKLPGETTMVYIVLFTILFYLFLIKKGVISNLLNNNFSSQLGQYAYSIYCFHTAIILIFRKTYLPHHTLLLYNSPLYIYIYYKQF